MDKIEFGKRLKEIREANKVSMYRLEKSGLNRTNVGKMEKGISSYTIDSLLSYCEASGIDIQLCQKHK